MNSRYLWNCRASSEKCLFSGSCAAYLYCCLYVSTRNGTMNHAADITTKIKICQVHSLKIHVRTSMIYCRYDIMSWVVALPLLMRYYYHHRGWHLVLPINGGRGLGIVCELGSETHCGFLPCGHGNRNICCGGWIEWMTDGESDTTPWPMISVSETRFSTRTWRLWRSWENLISDQHWLTVPRAIFQFLELVYHTYYYLL